MKPSLVEWKRRPHGLHVAVVVSLKPSLVEWKQNWLRRLRCWRRRSLKPSLVEWKLTSNLWGAHGASFLETFLGGMETTGYERHGSFVGWCLETFLGGMETCDRRVPGGGVHPLKPSLVEWKPQVLREAESDVASLETFLGGMETSCPEGIDRRRVRLETFLGGMETRPSGRACARSPGLETFLGGMETTSMTSLSP